MALLLKSLIIGFAASLFFTGPVALLCVSRTLSNGRWSGFLSGAGAAFADGVYALLAAIGVNYFLGFIEDQMIYLKLVGAVIIVILGLKIYFTKAITQYRNLRGKKNASLLSDFFSVLILTLSNPGNLIIFAGFFAFFNITLSDTEPLQISFAFLGVCVGACAWWFILSWFVGLFRKRLKIRNLFWINKIGGLVIAILGAGSLIWFFLQQLFLV